MSTSVLTQIPENTNFLQTTKFTFTFPQLPFLRYFGQNASLPGVATSEVMVPTPFSDTYRHGDKLVYDPLSLTFLVDEDLRVWEETYQWIASLTKPSKFGEFVKKFPDKYYDGLLTINTNANIPNVRIKFYNCHPTSLGAVQFATNDTPDLTPVCDLSIRYDRFEIERL